MIYEKTWTAFPLLILCGGLGDGLTKWWLGAGGRGGGGQGDGDAAQGVPRPLISPPGDCDCELLREEEEACSLQRDRCNFSSRSARLRL